MARILIEIAGVKFGRLTAVRDTGLRIPRKNQSALHLWLFLCDCGREKTMRRDLVISGNVRSCGCLLKDSCRARQKTHGATTLNASPGLKRAYNSWLSMLQRCKNSHKEKFSAYVGVTVCARWKGRNGFANFLSDMGERPEDKTLDRKNAFLGYSPDNCAWSDATTQARNQRRYYVDGAPPASVLESWTPPAPGEAW